MSLNWKQFEYGVLRPSLKQMESVMPSPEVAILLVGETIFHESDRLQALGQYPKWGVTEHGPFGPGLGIASIERATWDWMHSTKQGARILQGNEIFPDDYNQLTWDLRLNVTACRLRYFLSPKPLPALEDGMVARAMYWWNVYNGGQMERGPDYMKNAKAIPWAI